MLKDDFDKKKAILMSSALEEKELRESINQQYGEKAYKLDLMTR